MPVWKYDYSYKGTPYPFFINGQTGKLVGKAPVDPKRVWSFAAIVAAVILVLGLVAAYFMEFSFAIPVIASSVIGLIVGFVNLHPAPGQVTVNAATYVASENKKILVSTDKYLGRETKTRKLNNN